MFNHSEAEHWGSGDEKTQIQIFNCELARVELFRHFAVLEKVVQQWHFIFFPAGLDA